jgi:hypothetical protein
MPENYDEFDRQDDFSDSQDDSRRILERAKSAVMPAAICLIILGVISLLGGIANAYSYMTFDEQWDMQVKTQTADPNKTAQQKKEIQDQMESLRKPVSYLVLAVGSIGILVAAFIIFAGVNMMRLKSRGMAVMASILSMVPFFTGCCCVIGIPVGIWALMVLGRPEVKRGFELMARKS